MHPWQPRRRLLVTGWRLYYQGLISAPVLGERLLRDGRRLRAALRPSMDEAVLDEFFGRARSGGLRAALPPVPAARAARRDRRARGRKIELPVRALFGRRDSAQDYRQLRGLREHAPTARSSSSTPATGSSTSAPTSSPTAPARWFA